MAERDEARDSPNVRQLIDRYLEEHAAKLAKRNRDDQESMLRKLVEPAWGPLQTADLRRLIVLHTRKRTSGISLHSPVKRMRADTQALRNISDRVPPAP
jgi:RNase P/RNase MRP subunit POP5